MLAMTTNPIMSQIMGAAGDLGLSQAAQGEAADIAAKLKKKKQDDLAAAGQGVVAPGTSSPAMQSLMTGQV